MARLATGIGSICGVVAASTAIEMSAGIQAALRETPTIELRLDWLASDVERLKLLVWLRRHRPAKAIFLATCRRKGAGGRFAGDIQAQLFWLIQAREAGCQWCDIEIETIRELPNRSARGYAIPSRIMLSIHDFDRTPDLGRSVRMPTHGEIDTIKIAAHARTIADSVRLLRWASGSKDCVAVPMGEAGLPARILALKYGSTLEYAPIGAATAPGQVSLHDLKHLYRADKLNRSTLVFGVIGNPIAHSLSPLLHNSAFAAKNVNAVYLPFLVEKLPDFLKAIPEFEIRGFSVTIPHKQTILKYLKHCDDLAADIGAVNTVVVRADGSLFGSNTDYVGVLRSLEKKLGLAKSRVLIFGAGGAARAAAFALARAGASVAVCARRENAARELAGAIGGESLPRRALRSEDFDAILNTTPVGMHPRTTISPLTAEELNCRIVMDLIYRPEQTQLLQLAARQGMATVSGVEMFLAQGIAQWELWTKQRAPEAVMRRAILKALRGENSAAPSRAKSAHGKTNAAKSTTKRDAR
ncbi:MAG TPA: shikimate dehydrogenase [Candidatus Acidoferrales bacterium]|jgi:3-dehydroquinate dehydratase/shikimate dehydrogenase